MNGITFRKATEKDIPVIRELAIITWNRHYPSIITQAQIDYMLEKFHSEKSLSGQMQQGMEFFLAFLNNRAGGFGAVSTADHKNYFLHKLYVDKELNIKGLGTGLLNFILKGKPSIENIRLQVNRKTTRQSITILSRGLSLKPFRILISGTVI